MTLVPTRSRFWLYAPYVLVVAIVLGWAGLWFVIKGKVATGIDHWMAREGEAGREWRCNDRSIAGFPFRVEVKCSAVSLKRTADSTAPNVTLGPLLVAAQVYDPNFLAIEPKGPLVSAWADGRSTSLAWQAAQLSVRRAGSQLERASLVLERPVLTVAGFENANGDTAAARLEAHMRPTPARAADGAVDIAMSLDKLAMAALDQLFSNSDVTDLKIETTLTQSASFLGGITPATIEAWRMAGGAVDFTKLSLAKGTASLEGQAKLALDEYHRVRGRLEGAQTGIDTLGGVRIGAMLDAGALFAGRPAAQSQGGRSLKPLPPLEARDGRLYLGPLRIPGTPLKPLY